MRIFSVFVLFVSISLLMLSAYVLWNFNVMINEQLELIELESMLGSVDPVHVQHIEWVKNNGMIVALLVAVGSLIALIGAWFLRKLNRKGMLFQIIGASLVIAAMILLMNVHLLIAAILMAVQLLLMLVTVINRSKLN
jgi:hypothetical protein